MAWAAGLGAAGVSAVGGLLSNAQNAAYAQEAARLQYKYNLKLQKQAQEWQTEMSNTAHQREVDDLYAAGLNPILSATGGSGASSGSAGLNSTSAVQPNIQNPFGSAGELLSIANNAAQVDNLKAQTENLRQNTAKQAQETLKVYEEIGKTIAEKEETLSRIPVNSAQADKIRQDIQVAKAMQANILEDTRLKQQQASSLKMDSETKRIETENNPFKFVKSLLTNKDTPQKLNSYLGRYFQSQKGAYR